VTHLMRKHGKVILAVVGSLLMIVFILPTGRGSDTTAANYVRGHINGKKVVNADLAVAAGDIYVLNRVGRVIPIQGNDNFISLFRVLIIARRIPLTPKEDLQSVHWYLLLKEAHSFGIVSGEQEITDTIAMLKFTDAEMTKTLADLRIGQQTLRNAVGDALAIGKLAQLTMDSTQVSLPEVEYEANLDLSKIQIAYAAIDGAGGSGWEKSPAPTDEQIKKQFDLYKDVLPTPIPSKADENNPPPTPPTIDGHTYPFGYKYPDRVKVEYLRFDKSQLAGLMKPDADDYDAAFTYFTQHPEQFKNAGDSTDFMVSTRPASKSWDEVKTALVQKQFDQRVSKLLKKAAERALALANEPWKNVEAPGGFRIQIDAKLWPDYHKIEADIAANKDFLGLKPIDSATGWLGAEQLAKLPDIGDAYLQTPNGRIPFFAFATHVKDLLPPGAKDPLGRFFLEVGPEGPMLANPAGDLFVYRVTAAEKSHAPASLDEVRPQVIEDLKKIASYQRAQAEAKEIARQARSGDLLGIAAAKKLEAHTSKDITQTDTIPEIGPVPGFVEAAFALTKDPAATQPVKDSKRVSATTTFDRDSVLKVYAIELVNYTPANSAEFAAKRSGLVSQVSQQNRFEFMYSWLNLDAIAKRLNYVPERPFDTKNDDQG